MSLYSKLYGVLAVSIKNRKIKEFFHLLFLNILGIPIGIITSIYLARYLGSKGFGDYQFINSIFNLLIIIVTFGFLYSGNRVLVLLNDKEKSKEIYGAELVVIILVSFVMSVLLCLYLFFDKNIREKELVENMIYLIPFSWVFLFSRYFEVLLQADNQVKLLGYVRLLPKLGYLIVLSFIYYISWFSFINKIMLVWYSLLGVQILVYCFVFYKVGISFCHLYDNIYEIWRVNKIYGFNVYLGSLFAVGFSQLTGVLISYFSVDNVGVGFYSLSVTLCTPLIFIPNTMATIYYKEFAVINKINRNHILITYALSAVSLIGLWILIDPFIHYFYGADFDRVVALNFIVSIGILMHGLADFYNRFFSAKGQGKVLRNSSFIVGLSVMLFNILLIPKWGESGAAYARLLSGVVYFIIMYFQYKRFVSENEVVPICYNSGD